MMVGETMIFTPTQLLERNTTYHAKLAAGAKGESGGLPMPADFTWSFTTVKPFAVIRTDPAEWRHGGALRVDGYFLLRAGG